VFRTDRYMQISEGLSGFFVGFQFPPQISDERVD
jgi:hypothetical protein